MLANAGSLTDCGLKEGEVKNFAALLEEHNPDQLFGNIPRNAKLSDEEVELMRNLRQKYELDWDQLAIMFEVNWKTAYRICLGMSRPNCKGPIEELVKPQPMAETVRCKTCGGRHEKGKGCDLCQCRWAIHITRFLRRAGYIHKRDY